MDNPCTIGGFEFFFTLPQELPQVAGIISPGLTEIQKQARKSGSDWEIQNLLREISCNVASLVMIFREKEYVGFMVNKSVFEGLPNQHLYQTVALYIDPSFRDFEGTAYNAAEEYVTEFARQLKCHGCLQKSFRPGHGRRLGKRGYQLKEQTWIKYL